MFSENLKYRNRKNANVCLMNFDENSLFTEMLFNLINILQPN